MTFTVGDRVEFHNDPYYKGTITKILDKEFRYEVQWDKIPYSSIYRAEELRLVEAAASKFKVGDRVRQRKIPRNIGIITAINKKWPPGGKPYPISVNWNGRSVILCYLPEELELIEDDLPSYADGWNDGFKAGVQHAKVEMRYTLDKRIKEVAPKNP